MQHATVNPKVLSCLALSLCLQACSTVGAVATVASTAVSVAGTAAVATVSAAGTAVSAGASATKAVAETGGKLIDYAAQQVARDEAAKKAAEAAALALPK